MYTTLTFTMSCQPIIISYTTLFVLSPLNISLISPLTIYIQLCTVGGMRYYDRLSISGTGITSDGELETPHMWGIYPWKNMYIAP